VIALDLPYGRTPYRLRVDALGGPVILAEARGPGGPAPAVAPLLERALGAPVGSPPLEGLARAGDRGTVVISDASRAEPRAELLAAVRARLAGVRLTVAVATGTHRPCRVDALGIPTRLLEDAELVMHDGHDDAGLVTIGTTTRGTPVRLHRCAVEADVVVATGAIRPHYFAGFGGGRKALVPGCAGRETAHQTHFRIFRTDGPGKHPMARPGILAGNPVHEDIIEAVSMASPSFLVNTLLTPGKRLFDLVAGHWQKAHEEGCARYAKHFRVRIAKRYPLVIASAGGFPKDINLIQSHKALDNAFLATEPGGVLILLAECPDGFGSPHFFPWFRHKDPDALERELRVNYQIYGQTAHAVLTKTRACRVILVSSLPPEDVETMGMTPAPTLPDAIRAAKRFLGELPVPLVIPDAGYVLPDPAG